MPKTKTVKTGEKHPVQIILVGVPNAVIHLINLLHLVNIAKAGDWLEVNRNRAINQMTVTITINFML